MSKGLREGDEKPGGGQQQARPRFFTPRIEPMATTVQAACLRPRRDSPLTLQAIRHGPKKAEGAGVEKAEGTAAGASSAPAG